MDNGRLKRAVRSYSRAYATQNQLAVESFAPHARRHNWRMGALPQTATGAVGLPFGMN